MNSSKMSRLAVLLLALLVQAHSADYRFQGRRTAPGNDIDCGQKDGNGNPIKFCRICNGVAAVADACDSNASCEGFDMEGSYCGYLKAAAGAGKTAYTEGFSHYCKLDYGIRPSASALARSSSQCEGDYIARRRSDVLGKDVDCNAKDYQGKSLPYCEVSGSLNDVAAACTANPNCMAFTTTSNSGGYLKTAASPTTYTEGTVTYVKG